MKTSATTLGCKTMSEYSEIFKIADQLSDMATKCDARPLDKLMKAAEGVGKSWCGSWLGYHSRVYYKDLQPVPPGARFIESYVGDWEEYEFESVVKAIYDIADNPNCNEVIALSMQAKTLFDESQSRILSLLSPALRDHTTDTFLNDITDTIKKKHIPSESDFVNYFVPKGDIVSHDIDAALEGIKKPPHISVMAKVSAIRSSFTACDELSKLARRVASHLENLERRQQREARVGTNVFIGHGRSYVWKDLKDFIQDRLHLPYDEFNRVPVAGLTNTVRLSQMLDDAAVAFLILTGEDGRQDPSKNERSSRGGALPGQTWFRESNRST